MLKIRGIQKIIKKYGFSFREKISIYSILLFFCPFAPLGSSMLSQHCSILEPTAQRQCLLDSINSTFVVCSNTLGPCGGRQEHIIPQMPFYWVPTSHVAKGNEKTFFFHCICHTYFMFGIFRLLFIKCLSWTQTGMDPSMFVKVPHLFNNRCQTDSE